MLLVEGASRLDKTEWNRLYTLHNHYATVILFGQYISTHTHFLNIHPTFPIKHFSELETFCTTSKSLCKHAQKAHVVSPPTELFEETVEEYLQATV